MWWDARQRTRAAAAAETHERWLETLNPREVVRWVRRSDPDARSTGEGARDARVRARSARADPTRDTARLPAAAPMVVDARAVRAARSAETRVAARKPDAKP